MFRRITFSLLLAASLLSGVSVADEHSTRMGDFTIHYNALSTATLNPDIAKAYGLTRSKYRGLLNVSVIKEAAGTTGTSAPANVDVNIVTLTGQKSRIPMRMIQEQTAVYYIGEFPVVDQQTLNFEIVVKPEGAGESKTIQMSQQFFTE